MLIILVFCVVVFGGGPVVFIFLVFCVVVFGGGGADIFSFLCVVFGARGAHLFSFLCCGIWWGPWCSSF